MPWNDKGKYGYRLPEMKPKKKASKKYGPKPRVRRVKPDSPKLYSGPKIKRVKPKVVKPKPKKRKFKQTKNMKKV